MQNLKHYKKSDFVLNETSPELLEVWDTRDRKYSISWGGGDFYAYSLIPHQEEIATAGTLQGAIDLINEYEAENFDAAPRREPIHKHPKLSDE